MAAGRGRLRIESDGAVPLDRVRKRFEGERHPASLVVRGVCLRRATPEEREATPTVIAEGPGGGDSHPR